MGLLLIPYGKPDRPADVGVSIKGKTKVLTQLNEDILGYRKLGKVNEIIYNSSFDNEEIQGCLLYTSPSPRDLVISRMPSSA